MIVTKLVWKKEWAEGLLSFSCVMATQVVFVFICIFLFLWPSFYPAIIYNCNERNLYCAQSIYIEEFCFVSSDSTWSTILSCKISKYWLKWFGHNTYLNEKAAKRVKTNFELENIEMLAEIYSIVKIFWKMKKIDVSTDILDQSGNLVIFIQFPWIQNSSYMKNYQKMFLWKIMSNLEIMWKPHRFSQCFEILHEKMIGYVFTDDTKQNSSIWIL